MMTYHFPLFFKKKFRHTEIDDVIKLMTSSDLQKHKSFKGAQIEPKFKPNFALVAATSPFQNQTEQSLFLFPKYFTKLSK
jgi:hypothetical protein